MSLPFPTLDSIRPTLPKAEPQTEWVSALAQVPVATKRATGWVPPTYEPVAVVAPTVDFEALRLEVKEEGFCAGYIAGQRAGTERGLAEGRLQGREEGRAEAKAEVFAAEQGALQEFASALGSAAEEIGPAVQRWQEMVEARAAELAMDAVRALLSAELAIQRPDAMGVVREALGHAEGALKATIRLAPFDRAALAERKEDILIACASMRDVELVDDRSIGFGCVIETEQGVVDATLETRLSLLEAA